MEVEINGIVTTTNAKNLAELIAQQAVPTMGLAVALGARVVPKTQWETTEIAPGEVITLIRATQGG